MESKFDIDEVDEKFLLDNRFLKGDGYTLRISDLIWLEYELSTGFVIMRRKRENGNKKNIVEIMIPRPFRKKNLLIKLLELICG